MSNEKMRASRSEAIALMRRSVKANGVDLSKSWDVEHGILMFDLKQMSTYKAEVERAGFREVRRQMNVISNKAHLICISRRDSLDAQALGELIEHLDQLAQQFGGQHVGFTVQVAEEDLTGSRRPTAFGKLVDHVDIVDDDDTLSIGEVQRRERGH